MSSIIDVIAAISTPPGKGGVAVIRISGNGSFDVADKIFRTQSGTKISEIQARRQVYGFVYDNDKLIDDVMACRFIAPSSYTGEDTVEIYCHGGMLITRTVLELVLSAGARVATAGEFTRRAFINGKLTLTDAELITSLLEAKSKEEITLSGKSARERLNNKIKEIKSSLTDIMTSIYARIDYPEEDLGDFSDTELMLSLDYCLERLDTLISTYRTGRAICEGISTVLCGKPNVGKSSIYNALIGEDAAIVTSHAGTTRDVLERTTVLGRVTLRLKDTAGIHTSSNDEVEQIGIKRSCDSIKASELILAVFDISKSLDKEDLMLIDELDGISTPKIALLNKSDLANGYSKDNFPYANAFDEVLLVSAHNESEIVSALAESINRLMTDETVSAGDAAIISSARQHAELVRTRYFIKLAVDGLRIGFSQDAVSSDIERALASISSSDAREVSESVVNDIFSKFCVGK